MSCGLQHNKNVRVEAAITGVVTVVVGIVLIIIGKTVVEKRSKEWFVFCDTMGVLLTTGGLLGIVFAGCHKYIACVPVVGYDDFS